MKNSRRDFIKAAAAGAAVAATGVSTSAAAGEKESGHHGAFEPKSILILGGTGFIGPHMVREALRRGHSVTLFNRGRTNNELFPDLETIKGDRDNGLDGLKGRKWDAVIDNSGYVPRHVQDSARLLAPNCDRYVYISTIAVYEDVWGATGEDSPLATIADETVEEVTGETYGPLKALCEKRAAAEIDPDKFTILRPTYICGPGDHTDRFTYWPVRTRKGGEMLWPGNPEDQIQIVDVRDLATFSVNCVDHAINGTYNMVNPAGSYSMGQLLEDSQAVTATRVEPVWMDEEFLAAQELNPGAQLPIWAGSRETEGISVERALQQGFSHRPERETIRDLLVWWDTLSDERKTSGRVFVTADKEAEVLAAWKAR